MHPSATPIWTLFWALALTAITLPALAADDDEPKLPDPEEVTLTTVDNVKIAATYWEPKEPGTSTIPIILLHGWEGKRQEYDVLGRILQEKYGHAVISIDLRGHGNSTKRDVPGEAVPKDIDIEKMSKKDFEAMDADVYAAKKFLLTKHKAEKLNIELLTIVGADMGAMVALRYAAYDWRNQPRVHPHFKNGQDVRGLVLLSPPRTFKGITADAALKNPIVRGAVSTMIIVGANDRKAFGDAKSLHSALTRFHVRVPSDASDAEKEDKMDLFLMEPATTLQGTKLLAGALKSDLMIAKFIDLRLVKKSDDMPWKIRK